MDKVGTNVICKQTGKKYKISFTKHVSQYITTNHIIQHIRMIVPNINNFDLFFDGVLLQNGENLHKAINKDIQMIVQNQSVLDDSQDDYQQLDHNQQTPQKLQIVQSQPSIYQYNEQENILTSQKVERIRSINKMISSKSNDYQILEKTENSLNQEKFYQNNQNKRQAVLNSTQNLQIQLGDNSFYENYHIDNIQEIILTKRSITPLSNQKNITTHSIKKPTDQIVERKVLFQDSESINQQQIQLLQTEVKSLKQQLENTIFQQTFTSTDQIYQIVNEKIQQAAELSKSRIKSSQYKKTQNSQLDDSLVLSVNNQPDAEFLTHNAKLDTKQLEIQLTDITSPINKKQQSILQHQEQNSFEQKRIQAENSSIEIEILSLTELLDLNTQKLEIFSQDLNNTQQQHNQLIQEIQNIKNKALCYQKIDKDIFDWSFQAAELKQQIKELKKYNDELVLIQNQRRKLHNLLEDLKGNIRVFVRLRPLLNEELENNFLASNSSKIEDYISITTQQQIALNLPFSLPQFNQQQLFNFYRVYNYQTSQKTVFSDIKPLLTSAIDGFNITLLCYGSTGSGKTFTLIGDTGDSDIYCDENDKFSRLGILPRSVVELFQLLNNQTRQFSVSTAVVELYLDNFIDLLAVEQKELKIRYQNEQYFIQNLDFKDVTSPHQLLQILSNALESRHVSSTKCNSRSSRSHAIIYVRVKIAGRLSTIIFADLAGSERVEKSQSEGLRFKEAQFINQSLSALGDVVNALSNQNSHIPFRNSKLTQVLQPGLGGNSKTLLFVNLNPLYANLQESYSSLVFGTRSKAVQNVAVKGLFE
ncbi:Kinesin [Spironucleus salmonicida]|uniref:Kinesin n=1 Tax=Spironucleus salmonicida TaxID=348837 RepID=V6LPN3_9EUKA|nr:Kinesin [Spironucleus salmonicida]|eukprot:EST42694.1 Kinesin [Spironucleus salmonicida]